MPRAKAATKKSKPAPVTKARHLAAELAASPDDVELQRVFADALLEQGGEHAIRGEVIQRSLAGKLTDELAASFEQSLTTRGITGLQHAGGFVRSWSCSANEFAARAAELFADEPLLRAVVIRFGHKDATAQVKTLAATPELARVRWLMLLGHKQRSGRPGPKGLAALFKSPHWPSLEGLLVPNCALGDAGAKLIAKAASLAGVRELDVSSNDLLASSIVALASSPHFGALRRLNLSGNKPGDRGIKALVESRFITKLEWIDTSLTWLAPINVAPLKERWPDLEHVHNPHLAKP